jgi:hypothetical protein
MRLDLSKHEHAINEKIYKTTIISILSYSRLGLLPSVNDDSVRVWTWTITVPENDDEPCSINIINGQASQEFCQSFVVDGRYKGRYESVLPHWYPHVHPYLAHIGFDVCPVFLSRVTSLFYHERHTLYRCSLPYKHASMASHHYLSATCRW